MIFAEGSRERIRSLWGFQAYCKIAVCALPGSGRVRSRFPSIRHKLFRPELELALNDGFYARETNWIAPAIL